MLQQQASGLYMMQDGSRDRAMNILVMIMGFADKHPAVICNHAEKVQTEFRVECLSKAARYKFGIVVLHEVIGIIPSGIIPGCRIKLQPLCLDDVSGLYSVFPNLLSLNIGKVVKGEYGRDKKKNTYQ